MTRPPRNDHNVFDWMEARVGRPRPHRHDPSNRHRLAALQAENLSLRRELGELRHELERRTLSEAAAAGGAANRTLEEVESEHIAAVLETCDWRIKGARGAAEVLGLNPGTLYSRMRKLGIERPDR